MSEQAGYAQLYVKPLDGKARQLTTGHFEVRLPQVSPDGRWFYVLANKQAPGALRRLPRAQPAAARSSA